MTEQAGKPNEKQRKLPERADALKLDLPFATAIKAALNTKPPPRVDTKRPGRKKAR